MPRTRAELDLHNLFTFAVNADFDPVQYLEALDLHRVIELHLAGGRPSDPAWLPSGRSLRLDGHDDAVPEAVWTDPDGFRIAALLVAKLRFERILRGRREAAEWFARDPEGFTAAFRAYHHATPPTAFFPGRRPRSSSTSSVVPAQKSEVPALRGGQRHASSRDEGVRGSSRVGTG